MYHIKILCKESDEYLKTIKLDLLVINFRCFVVKDQEPKMVGENAVKIKRAKANSAPTLLFLGDKKAIRMKIVRKLDKISPSCLNKTSNGRIKISARRPDCI